MDLNSAFRNQSRLPSKNETGNTNMVGSLGSSTLTSASKNGNFWDLLEVVDPFLWDEENKIDMDFFEKGGVGVDEEQGLWSDPFVVDFAQTQWGSEDAEIPLPSYLMAGGLLSPTPDMDYSPGQFENNSLGMIMPDEFHIKQEPLSPGPAQERTFEKFEEPSTNVKKKEKCSSDLRRSARTRRIPVNTTQSPSRPLVERLKRQSDDDGDSLSSVMSDASDGTDGSASTTSTTGPGMPSLPKITTGAFVEHKRQRKDVSMSAPAVAARELRQKKKQREEQLITECQEYKVESETMEREIKDARIQLDRLREDAAYLRSLVKSQESTISLLEYLQQAPFFKSEGKQLNLDARTMLRQISGTEEVECEAAAKSNTEKKDIGGVCLHINGSNITLHLCSHCGSEATQ